MYALPVLLLATALAAEGAEVSLDPLPRPVASTTAIARWDFNQDPEGWVAAHECEVSAEGGSLRVRSTGDDPYLHCPVDLPGGQLVLTLRARGGVRGGGSVYWTTDRSPGWGQDKCASLSLPSDGQWHESSARFEANGRLGNLRLDPGQSAGELEIDWIRLERATLFPLGIEQVSHEGKSARFTVKNHDESPVAFAAAGQSRSLAAGATLDFDLPVQAKAPLEAVSLVVELPAKPEVSAPAGGPPRLVRTIFLLHPEAAAEWITRPMAGGLSLRVARDGSVAQIVRDGGAIAWLGPTVCFEDRLPAMKLAEESGGALVFEGEGVTLRLAAREDEIDVAIASPRPCQGPVVRALGRLEQGVFAGLEYLGPGERSSSKLDIETPEHLRYAPERRMVTMPLMAVVTDRASVALTWRDVTLQPLFASPNFLDRTDDHRMALAGEKIEATVRVGRGPIEETIFWAVKRSGLPPLPPPPRDAAAQKALCLAALAGPLKNQDGWGHCAEANWGRQPYADMASTLWRLSGTAPDLPRLTPGGAHVANDAIYFVTGRTEEWLAARRAQAKGLIAQQKPDGSFEYHGPYRRGHFEDTASGVCGLPAMQLLQIAQFLGDEEAKAAGLRTLDYVKRFRVPRGAQTWELSMHTPDLLASAYLVWAYTLGYELTGKEEYLAEARRWALSGVPFVYLWSDRPVMLYATVPVYGATNWQAPNWMGLPVQWVGGVYAYALTKLAPHERSLDWNHLARGILISAQQQQYPDGPHQGLLPDSFALADQLRRPPDINPCAVVSLEYAVEGRLDSLAVAEGGGHRVVSPFPVEIRDGHAYVRAAAGAKYQLLLDGRRIVEVASKGDDAVPLAP